MGSFAVRNLDTRNHPRKFHIYGAGRVSGVGPEGQMEAGKYSISSTVPLSL